MKARNDENLEGIQGLARGLGRLLPGGGARGEAIAELQARAEAAEREHERSERRYGEVLFKLGNAQDTLRLYEGKLRRERERLEAAERNRDNARDSEMRMARKLDEAEATLAAVREWAENEVAPTDATSMGFGEAQLQVLSILDGEGEK